MALIVGGTTVTGTQTLDATKLTGNLPALNGSALTNITSGASVQSSWTNVGSYVLGDTSQSKAGDQTAAFPGAYNYFLKAVNASGTGSTGGTPSTSSGTWRCMGNSPTYYQNGTNTTLWHRIS